LRGVKDAPGGQPRRPEAPPVPPGDAALGRLGLSLLNAIGEGVALASREGAVAWCNELIVRLGGGMQERLSAACRQFDREHPMPPHVASGGVPLAVPSTRLDVVLADADRFYEATLMPLDLSAAANAGLGPEWLVIVLRDVSAAKRLQQRINAIDQAGGELVKIDPETVRRFNAHERLKLLETKIVSVARNILHFDHFAIRLLDERSGRLELVIGCNLPTEFDAFIIKPALEGFGISGYVAASGRSYLCPDTGNDALYLPGVEGAKSSLTLPLRVFDKVIGIINVESLTASAFTEEDRQLGEIFARYVAMAIHMLDLLVVERSATNQTVAGRVATQITEPLEDIAHEVEILKGHIKAADPSAFPHLDRITSDLASIRTRILECAAGPGSLLGVEQAMAQRGEDPIIRGRRVLLADDEPRIRKTIGDVLAARGATVRVCANGSEALQALESAPGAFDLVISDIRMPDHNGYEIFSATRRLNPTTPVILMTGFGYDPHHSIVRASQEGLQTVLFKPFQVERLLDDVRKALSPAPEAPPEGRSA